VQNLAIGNAAHNNKVRSIRSSGPELAEQKLVSAARRGESTAFAALCEQYSRKLVRAAFRVTRNHEDAEDAVQDALLNAFLHVEDFDGRSSFATWLTRIAINSALMILRKRRSALEMATKSIEDLGTRGAAQRLSDRGQNQEHDYAAMEEKIILNQAIQRLRPNLRQIITLQHLQERPMREAAELVGISVGTAKARLFHAKAALRRSAAMKMMAHRRSSEAVRTAA